MKRSGASLLALVLLFASACMPYSFAGGGLPPHIRTVAVLPFENETAASGLERDIHERLRREVESRLGLRSAAETRAHAVVRGRITRYEPDVPVAYSADPGRGSAARRRLQIVVDVTIVDQTSGRTLWERQGLSAEGEYAERAELDGRRQAIDRLIRDVISGTQSQW